MPCPQGGELPGDVPMLSSFCGWSDDHGDVTVGCPLGGMGLNVGDGLGTKPETDGNGVGGKGYIPSLLLSLNQVYFTGDPFNYCCCVVQFWEQSDIIVGLEAVNGQQVF